MLRLTLAWMYMLHAVHTLHSLNMKIAQQALISYDHILISTLVLP